MLSEQSEQPKFKPRAIATGRCYCGAVSIRTAARPRTVAYCHCTDCRRWTGGPVGAFAAFAKEDVELSPTQPDGFTAVPGVIRWSCKSCGSPLAAQFDYLPGQTYVPLGVLDNAHEFSPEIHCHADNALEWLHITDELPRAAASGREILNASNDD